MRRRHDAKRALLRTVGLWSHLSDKELALVARLVYEIQFRQGTVLMEQGRRGAEAFVIIDGRVRVVRDGRELAELGAGAVVGELALLDPAPRSATVVAVTDVNALVLNPSEFHRLITDVPDVGRRVMKQLSDRLRTTDAALTTKE